MTDPSDADVERVAQAILDALYGTPGIAPTDDWRQIARAVITAYLAGRPDALGHGADADMNAQNLRQAMINLLWETKKLFPRGKGTPYPQFINDADNVLWGWRMPKSTPIDDISAKRGRADATSISADLAGMRKVVEAARQWQQYQHELELNVAAAEPSWIMRRCRHKVDSALQHLRDALAALTPSKETPSHE